MVSEFTDITFYYFFNYFFVTFYYFFNTYYYLPNPLIGKGKVVDSLTEICPMLYKINGGKESALTKDSLLHSLAVFRYNL